MSPMISSTHRSGGTVRSLTLAVVVFLGAPALHAQASPYTAVALAPRSQRVSDDVIARDLAQLDLLTRTATQAGDARAVMFVQLARDAYERNDDGTLSALMLGAAAGQARVTRVARPDLWQVMDSVRAVDHGDDSTSALAVALENALVRAQYPLLGAPSCAAWERDADRLAVAIRSRQRPAVIAVAPVVEPPPPPRDTAPVTPLPPRLEPIVPTELRGVPSMVHFALDRHDLSRASRNVLAALVDSLRYFSTVQIVLEGHTDLRASVDYNLALSRRRTESVRGYLELLGIAPTRIRVVAQGKSQLQVQGTDALSHARNRRVQLRYFTPDGTELPTVELLDDLQLERAAPRRRQRPR